MKHRKPLLHQDWRNLLFLHWEVQPNVIQQTLPPGLKVDTFNGKAFLGIVAFEMLNLRLHHFITFPGISHFNELNLRTYVVDEQGRSGVWFYSLEAESPISVWIANTCFRLPYRNARMSNENQPPEFLFTSTSKRDTTREKMQFRFSLRSNESPVEAPKNSLNHFLVERYRLFTCNQKSGSLLKGNISHAPYQICEVDLHEYSTGLFPLNGFETPTTPPMSVLYSPGVNVDLYRLKKIR